MKLIVTLESMLYNDLKLEEIWQSFGDNLNIFKLVYNLFLYITNRYQIQGNLTSLPYSSFFFNIYKEDCKKYNDIIIAVPQYLNVYISLITSNLSDYKQIKEIFTYDNNDDLNMHMSEYIDSFFHTFELVNKYNSKFMIVQNIFSYLRLMLSTNVQIYRMSLFHGIGWILWSLFSYYMPLLFMWPTLFRFNINFHGQSTWIALGLLMLHIGFVRLMRILQEIDHERYNAQINKLEPLCSEEYIFYGTSITAATFVLFVLFILILIFIIKYPIISLCVIITSLTYYIFMLSPLLWKSLITMAAMIISHSLIQYKWVLSLFR